MDETQMRIVNEGGATRPRVWKETPTLFLKFSGTKGTVDDNTKTVREIMKPYSPLAFEKESLYSLLAMREDGEEMWNTDVTVPLSRLADIIEDSKAHAASLGLKACVKGHIVDSNFHENITYNKADPKEAGKAKIAVKAMVKRVLEMEGTCTGEHGVGIGHETFERSAGSILDH
ncbi:hypothetical protein CEP51_005158 [Fusarium floridanum]|uniref:FAD-binding oxidoreductase/transferase type 4 C-terminal domain-containing protein n=1 Tax=Fusarium floridanum TaxID=1325733 RepID=A0A428RY35_9HYPO|nr:hypothetical protein CEP51_005158 [Fusarium floridanum]